MFLRSILYPSLVACVIGAPMMYSTSWDQQRAADVASVGYQATTTPSNWPNGASLNQASAVNSPTVSQGPTRLFAPTGFAIGESESSGSGATLSLPQFASQNSIGTFPTSNAISSPEVHTQVLQQTQTAGVPNGIMVSGPIINGSNTANPVIFGMTPDFGATETFVFPGDASGPDLSATPTDFVPITNLAEILRFDVYPNWVKSRWKRISTNPGIDGLHGLRVAVVTGTNSWDLHGALTYYFDVNQRAQRITFRGWTGDSSRLVSLLTSQFGLKAQPTHWAGVYAAKNERGSLTAGLLMQHPAVITKENPVQQVALEMEVNHPQGSFPLSERFVNMLRHAVSVR